LRQFAYRFQRVLEIKGRMEDARKAALGEVVSVLNQEEETLRDLQDTRKRYVQAGRFQPAAPVEANLLDLQAAFLQRLKREQIKLVEAVVEEKRKELMEATKERRVFEILREQREVAYKRERKRQERRLLDDVGNQLYLRRRNERE
jgi:flagellar FliJ protein